METIYTTISKSHRLQKQINEDLFPNKIDRLKKGCQIICKYNGLMTLSQDAERHKESEFYYCYGFDESAGFSRTCKGNELLEVLGKPIDFTDLCLFLSSLENVNILYLQFNNNEKLLQISISDGGDEFILSWDCKKDFHNQNIASYNLLDEIIN